MYFLSTSCISPQDTFSEAPFACTPPLCSSEGNRRVCIEPDYKSYITDATLRRRMSRVVKMGVASGMRCVAKSGILPDAIVTATGLGCLADTEKFLAAQTDHGQINPTPFIQSTFNTVGAQLALLLNNHGSNNTYVHRTHSFESALLDAVMQIDEGAQNILVGSFDEITDTSFDIMRRLGFWKSAIAGEGAAFFMLGSGAPPGFVQLSGVRFFEAPVNNNSLYQQIGDFLTMKQRTFSDIDLLLLGNNGDIAYDDIYRQLIADCFPNQAYCFFKNLCGEYWTSSSFGLYLSIEILQSQKMNTGLVYNGNIPQKIRNVLVYNHQDTHHSLMLCNI